MFITAGTNLIMTDSLGVQTSLWSLEGKRLVRTDGDIHPFREGYAVSTKRGTVLVRGFYKDDGSFIPVPEGYGVFGPYPFVSNGHLLVKEPVTFFFRFIDKDGTVSPQPFVEALPFFNGYASCSYYLTPEKKKDMIHCLLNSDLKPMVFLLNGKQVAPADIEFISSVNDENIAVVVSKKKVFLFDSDKKALFPLGPVDGGDNSKDQARLLGEFEESFVHEGDSVWILNGKCSKQKFVEVRFDRFMRPTSIRYPDKTREFVQNGRTQQVWHSLLNTTIDGGKYGLIWDDVVVLPPQFEEQPSCFDDKAIVRMDDRYGLLQLDTAQTFHLSMFKGKDIPFKHQTFETTIRLDLPTTIRADRVSIEMPPDSGCEIDRTSGEFKNTMFGNYVQYDCTLHIPQSLSDDETTEIEYPLHVIYEGLISPLIPFSVKAWHYKYFVVDIIESETALDKGNLSFTFNINAERDQDVYPMSVDIQADSLAYELEKFSEARYKCRVQNLREGVNNIVVRVVEQGCPPVSFPFEITYTKPVAQTKTQPAVKEEVVIKKKESPKPSRYIPRVEM